MSVVLLLPACAAPQDCCEVGSWGFDVNQTNYYLVSPSATQEALIEVSTDWGMSCTCRGVNIGEIIAAREGGRCTGLV